MKENNCPGLEGPLFPPHPPPDEDEDDDELQDEDDELPEEDPPTITSSMLFNDKSFSNSFNTIMIMGLSN